MHPRTAGTVDENALRLECGNPAAGTAVRTIKCDEVALDVTVLQQLDFFADGEHRADFIPKRLNLELLDRCEGFDSRFFMRVPNNRARMPQGAPLAFCTGQSIPLYEIPPRKWRS